MNKAQLKEAVCKAIDTRFGDIDQLSEDIFAEPELGFKEEKTSAKVKAAFDKLGLDYSDGWGITGVKARMKGRNHKKTVALLGELDAIICRDHPNSDPVTGAAHCCGHNVQIANMMAVAMAFKDAGIMNELDGDVVFFADDIDMALQMHVHPTDNPNGLFEVGGSCNGFIGKLIEYRGRAAHAAGAPDKGINALNAAVMGIMGVNAIRETFRDDDCVRFHPIINAGGDLVNVVPDFVKMESYVRAARLDGLTRYNQAINRALKAGADAIGASCEIKDLPGYLPLRPDENFRDVLRANAQNIFGTENVAEGAHNAGSTDMGDVSHLIPVVHPWVGCATGILHGANFILDNKDAAFRKTAKVLAMTIIDLLADDACEAQRICDNFKPVLTKETYCEYMDSISKVQ